MAMNDSTQYQADIVVIGSGGGLTAAVTATEAGAKVIVLDKLERLGGYTRQANVLMACESPAQKRQNIDVTKDEVFRRFMRWAHCRRVNPRVVRAYFNQTGETIEWLEAKGVEFELISPPGILPVMHRPSGMGDGLQKALINSCKDLGITTMLKTSAKKILLGENGQVTGVNAENEEGEFTIETKGVIIATGGFGENRELLKKYCPDYYEAMPTDLWPGREAHMGDGLLMAEEIGAALADSVPNYHMGPYIEPYMYPFQKLAAMVMNQKTIWVNKRGRRFTDEAGSLGMGVYGNSILMQPDKVMYSVFDDEIRRDVEEGLSLKNSMVQVKHAKPGGGTTLTDGKYPGLAEKLRKEAEKTDKVKISDSWDDIAQWIGAKPEVLKSEIKEYNGFCDKGYDEVFTKDKEHLAPLRKPPFYALRCECRVGETLGGIKVNEHMEILNPEDEAIPGAYAAGVIADGFEPEDYCREMPGCAMGFAVNSCRIAGRQAARFVLGKD